jgi:hypothetical protein
MSPAVAFAMTGEMAPQASAQTPAPAQQQPEGQQTPQGQQSQKQNHQQ